MTTNTDSRHLERLQSHYAQHESLPSYSDIGRLLGLASKSSVHKLVLRFIEAGLFSRGPGERLVATDDFLAGVQSSRFALLPLVGRVAAGQPILAEQNVEDRCRVDPRLFRPRADFLLRVKGDSMRDAGILDGDLLAVHRTQEVRNGQIIVARLEDEATVKRFEQRGNIVWLKPENPDYEPIRVDLREQELVIEGIYAGLVRTPMHTQGDHRS